MRDEALEVAPRIWWVGKHLAGDPFQCHAYLIENGEDSVLIDPGSALTITSTLEKVQTVVDLDQIRYLVCHHPDPDIAACLPVLSEVLPRPDAVVVTEWRAQALLQHYGHRFDYWLIEDHDWHLALEGCALEFQLTPYLHFPGAFMSFHTATGTLFTSDLFGGFVAEDDPLVATDITAAVEAARPFHQHYMPSASLLQAALQRVRQRWPTIDLIAPQHGHLIPGPMVDAAFDGLMGIQCGVFALSDVDHDLQHLLRLAEAKAQLVESLLTIADPHALISSLDAALRHTHPGCRSELLIDVPGRGWTEWRAGIEKPATLETAGKESVIELAGTPVALLGIEQPPGEDASDVVAWLQEMATSIRPAVDQYVERLRDADRISRLRRDALTDPLTGQLNRRALDQDRPAGHYSLIALDLDHFKRVNDHFGHASGDHVLRQVARLISREIRDSDRAYRVGGEEFLIVLPSLTGEESARVAERIRLAVAALDLTGHADLGTVTISAGVIEATAPADQFDAFMAKADTALYASKDLGRDRVTLAH